MDEDKINLIKPSREEALKAIQQSKRVYAMTELGMMVNITKKEARGFIDRLYPEGDNDIWLMGNYGYISFHRWGGD